MDCDTSDDEQVKKKRKKIPADDYGQTAWVRTHMKYATVEGPQRPCKLDIARRYLQQATRHYSKVYKMYHDALMENNRPMTMYMQAQLKNVRAKMVEVTTELRSSIARCPLPTISNACRRYPNMDKLRNHLLHTIRRANVEMAQPSFAPHIVRSDDRQYGAFYSLAYVLYMAYKEFGWHAKIKSDIHDLLRYDTYWKTITDVDSQIIFVASQRPEKRAWDHKSGRWIRASSPGRPKSEYYY